jgi:hypothetical protein
MVRRERWTAARAGVGVAMLAAAWLALPGAARAEDCTWGQPGYRACVEAKLEELHKQEAGQEPKKVYKTVPASKRPPSLTPDTYVRERPRTKFPANDDYGDAWNPERSQRQFNANQGRIQQQLSPTPILPPNNTPYTVPGRICPQGGC